MPTGLLLDLFFEEQNAIRLSIGIPVEFKQSPLVVKEIPIEWGPTQVTRLSTTIPIEWGPQQVVVEQGGFFLGGGGAPPWWYYNFGAPQTPQEHLHPERVKRKASKRAKKVTSIAQSELLVLATKYRAEHRRDVKAATAESRHEDSAAIAAREARLRREDEELLLLV